jgi:hypothetical protein
MICRDPFDFASGESAIVLRHVAYGSDFVHAGACLEAARTWIFAEPDYDCAAFALDTQRRRVREVTPAQGWAAVVTETTGHVLFEPLLCWARVELAEGTQRVEGLVRPDEWLDEPGGAEFPEARRGGSRWLGYVSANEPTAEVNSVVRCSTPSRDARV